MSWNIPLFLLTCFANRSFCFAVKTTFAGNFLPIYKSGIATITSYCFASFSLVTCGASVFIEFTAQIHLWWLASCEQEKNNYQYDKRPNYVFPNISSKRFIRNIYLQFLPCIINLRLFGPSTKSCNSFEIGDEVLTIVYSACQVCLAALL